MKKRKGPGNHRSSLPQQLKDSKLTAQFSLPSHETAVSSSILTPGSNYISIGEEMPIIHTWRGLLGIPGTNLLALDSAPRAGTVTTWPNAFSRPRGPTQKTAGREVKTTVLRMSSDTQMAQQDHTVHLEAAVTNLVRTYRWRSQGAGGRRCEAEG